VRAWLLAVPPLLAEDVLAASHHVVLAAGAPRPALDDLDRAALAAAQAALDYHLKASAEVVDRLCCWDRQALIDYWRAQQPLLLEPFERDCPPPPLPLPSAFQAIVRETPCPHCRGVLLQGERIVRSADEAALIVMRCTSCSYERKLDA
jgi:hypothetical protein